MAAVAVEPVGVENGRETLVSDLLCIHSLVVPRLDDEVDTVPDWCRSKVSVRTPSLLMSRPTLTNDDGHLPCHFVEHQATANTTTLSALILNTEDFHSQMVFRENRVRGIRSVGIVEHLVLVLVVDNL